MQKDKAKQTSSYAKIDINNLYINQYTGEELWYTDVFGNRYTPKELRQLILACRHQQSLPDIVGTICKHRMAVPLVNLGLDTQGRICDPLRKINEIAIKPKQIYLVTEDQNSGGEFYCRLLVKMFPDIDFVYKPAHGITTVDSELKSIPKSSKVIVCIDFKQNAWNTGRSLDRIAGHTDLHIFVFHPTSIEEVILSNAKLKTRPKSSKLRDMILQYYNSGNIYYSFDNDSRNIYLNDGTKIYNLEQQLFQELSNLQVIPYNKGTLNACLSSICCPVKFHTQQGLLSLHSTCKESQGSDTLYLAYSNQLLAGLYNQVLNLLEGQEHYLQHWQYASKALLYQHMI